jgi:ceramide glucosyltransferase
MNHYASKLFQILALLGCCSSFLYYLLCLSGALAFWRQKRAAQKTFPPADLPPVSILKPLKGTDPEIYESFRSHCLQDYPEYEILFGVSDPADPAVATVQQLQREFPERTIHLVFCSKILGTNVKVSNLEQMVSTARYDRLIVNDSDIRVERDYLRRIVSPLAEAKVGMVTCLYRGVPAGTLGSRLESLGIETEFCAGVLAARLLEGGLKFGLGSTLAFRRADLERIGGFGVIADFLADDYELGRRIAELGLQVLLSDVVVETFLPEYELRGFWSHQLRWARGVRDARGGGYFGLASTYGLFWSILALIAAKGALWAWAVLGAVVLARLAQALVIGKGVLQDRNLLRNLWLLPLRDLIAVVIWVASFSGHTVTWRGDRFELKKGRLVRTES